MASVIADISQWNSLQAKVSEAQLALAFETFRDAGVEPILIKGFAAERYYPRERSRRPGDIDLAVQPEHYSKALSIVSSGFLATVPIDLHQGLRQLDTVPWQDLFARSTTFNLNGVEIRMPSDEDHLRILCTHWLIDGGGYKDKLWDIYYAVDNRSPDFDWDRCLNVVSPIRRGWVVCTIGLAHKYLGLETRDLPFRQELEHIPKWISRCIEREWDRNKRLEPILASTHDNRLLLHQIMRRIPPNPLRSTIEAEGDLYGNKRMIYQAQVVMRRAVPFARDVVRFAKLRLRGEQD